MKKKFYLILSAFLLPFLVNAQSQFNLNGKHLLRTPDFNFSKNQTPGLFATPLSGYYREDFEGALFPPAGWQAVDVLNPNYNWTISDGIPYNGSQSAYIGFDQGNIPIEDYLILPKFSVVPGDSFSFYLALQYAGWPPDSTFVLVSTTDSAISSFTTVLATLAEGLNYPTGAEVYQNYAYSLSAFAGSDIYLAIKNKNTNGDGVLIDKVEIGTRPVINAGIDNINLEKVIQTGNSVIPTALVSNSGQTTQSFAVTMQISSGYLSVQNITNMAPGTTLQVNFDPWITPSLPGVETASVVVSIPGDGFAGDDSISRKINVLEPFLHYGWSSKAPISPFKWGIPQAAINSNDSSYLFIMGGNIGGANYTNAGRKYSPFSNTWTNTSNMNQAAGYACGASYNNKIYVIGGYSATNVVSNSNRIYDPVANSWSFGAPCPVPIANYAFGVYQDSLFYYIAGDDNMNFLNTVYIYNASSNTWSSGTNLPFTGNGLSAGISGNKIVVCGGWDGQPRAFAYLGIIDPADPTLISWSQIDDYPAGPVSTLGGGASLDQSSGLVIFTGGAQNTSVPLLSSKYTLAYDVNSNSWKLGPDKITPTNNLMNLTSVVHNDSLYIVSVGGYGANAPVNVNEWLNLGPYTIPTGNADIYNLKGSFSCSPNPFNDMTFFDFTLTETKHVKAIITDVTGKEIEKFCDTQLMAGDQRLKWAADKYPSGMYFCKLIIGTDEVVAKLIKY
jgi:hypothetical protein